MEIPNVLTKSIIKKTNQSSFLASMRHLPSPETIVSRNKGAIETYRELKYDAHLWSCIQSRKSGVLSLNYEFIGDGSEFFKLVESTLQKLDMHKLISEILEAPLFGWQPIEINWQIIGAKYKYALPESLNTIKQEYFVLDDNGNLFYQSENDKTPQPAPKYKFLCPKFESDSVNPAGHSLLAKCYWAVVFKNTALKNWVSFCEKYGMPILMGQYQRGSTSEEAERLANALADMSEDSIIVSPSDISISLHEASRNSSIDLYHELIKYCNSEISKAILSQTLTTELDMGSYAAAQTHFKIRNEVIKNDVKLVEATINKLLQYIIELNGFNSEIKFRFIIEEEKN